MRDERHFRNSTHREKIVEHLFIGELLRFLWIKKLSDTQVLRSEVDAAGYDLVITHGRITRHIQLKASVAGGSTRNQKINGALADLAGGCVIWIVADDNLSFQNFLWFGTEPNAFLKRLRSLKRAKSTRGNASGVKSVRKDTWVVPRSKFTQVDDMAGIVQKLFTARTINSNNALKGRHAKRARP